MHARRAAFAAMLALAGVNEAAAIAVVGTTPSKNASNVARAPTIAIDFDRAVDPATVTSTSVRVWARSGGLMPGTLAFANGNARVVFTPSAAFFPGEQVYVQLANAIRGADASPLRQGGYAFSFLTRAGNGGFDFREVETVTVRTTPSQTTRLYGGAFPDLNNDGSIDYVAVNEVSFDLRVLMNRADGSGRVFPVRVPTTPIGQEASPNEAADYDWDGNIDIAVSNSTSSTVSIVLGRGDGNFDPQQQLAVGQRPHGIAALDVDGDGDLDLVNANQNSSNVTVLRNDGNGVFGNLSSFDTGGGGEYGLASGDMNEDGLMDVVVAARNDDRLYVMLGNGDGTFTKRANPANATGGWPTGGDGWMIATGDVNGDGHVDVAAANQSEQRGSIVLGNGDGTMQAPVTYALGGWAIATDLGDLDGDGDLDWVLSSYTASRWYVLENTGGGTYVQRTPVLAPQAGSCASIYDFDNDGDLDLALADELEDVVRFMANDAPYFFRDGFE